MFGVARVQGPVRCGPSSRLFAQIDEIIAAFETLQVESKPCGFEDPLPPERDELTWTLEEDKSK